MVTLKMEADAKTTLSPFTSAPIAAQASLIANQNVKVPGLGSIVSVRLEFDDVMADMKEFYRAEPDSVMAAVSSHGARLVEIIVQIQRIETVKREWKSVREEAERILNELKSQFSIASRLIAIRQMDFDLSRGQAG